MPENIRDEPTDDKQKGESRKGKPNQTFLLRGKNIDCTN